MHGRLREPWLRPSDLLWPLAIALLTLVGCVGQVAPSSPSAPAANHVEVTKLADSVWMHTGYETMPEWGPVLSHGIIVKTGDGVWLIDTAWNDAQTRELEAWTEA